MHEQACNAALYMIKDRDAVETKVGGDSWAEPCSGLTFAVAACVVETVACVSDLDEDGSRAASWAWLHTPRPIRRD